MMTRTYLAAALLLLALGLGAPTAQTAPASQDEASSVVIYLPLIMHNAFEPVIAFATNREGNFEIYVVNPRSMTMRNVTGHEAQDLAPAFGPRGLLAWASARDGNWEIYSGDLYGRNTRRLTFDPGVDYDPTWSPEGRRIAFSSGRSGNMDIWAMDANGTSLVNLTAQPSQQRQPAWSPDGRTIAYASDEGGKDDIYIMGADGSSKTRLTDLPSSHEQFPAWSADGQWIIFTTDLNGKPELYAIHVERRTLQPVRSGSVFDAEGSWSGDGKRVAFRSTGGDGNTDLYVINFDGIGLGSGLRRLTIHNSDDIQPAWSR
ncbi:MAG: TolB family protein [Anaerolineae bacterium]